MLEELESADCPEQFASVLIFTPGLGYSSSVSCTRVFYSAVVRSGRERIPWAAVHPSFYVVQEDGMNCCGFLLFTLLLLICPSHPLFSSPCQTLHHPLFFFFYANRILILRWRTSPKSNQTEKLYPYFSTGQKRQTCETQAKSNIPRRQHWHARIRGFLISISV